ncbi:MAG: CheR family methyltransferase [Halanaerobiales bacterium]
MSSKISEQMQLTEKELYVVGIGASAGGLDALNRFFESMSDHPGMAFVIIQHLSPDHESHMVNLLSKRTKMKVREIEDGVEIKANTVYIIPPRKNLIIHDEKLYLKELKKKEKRYLNLPIDEFFKSLSEDKGNKAVGIILSGTGSDGVRGIRAIKENEGMVMVQKKDTAKFNGMPANSIATGIVDYILPPEKMGEKLVKFISHPYVTNKKDSVVKKQDKKNENTMTKILSLVKDKADIDFFQYKESTVMRRIERRMIINQIKKLDHYYSFLQQSDFELKTLARELLIGVTNFFRDEEAFAIIQNEVIPKLIENKDDSSEIRIWAAGCSTGEEVYSLAILFMEYLEEHRGNEKVKIFATDIQEDLLRKASIGKYPGSIVADVSPERLKRFFAKEGKMYRINKNIREMVIFSKHDLTSDPPFHKIDLISCRNLLIYLKPGIQQKIISNFKFSLNNKGYLFLGSSETLGEMFNNFKVINSKWNIFQCKKCNSSLNEINQEGLGSGTANVKPRKGNKILKNNQTLDKKTQKTRIEDKIKLVLLQNQLSDTIVIDENNRLIYLVGDINQYFNFPQNKVSLNVIDMSPEGLKQALNIAINRMKRDQEDIIYRGVEFNKDNISIEVDLHLSKLEMKEFERELISIRFIEKSTQKNKEVKEKEFEYNEDEHARQRIRDLEQELEYTRENLQATIEELETSNEELQATNEELMASNQQLQSTNEELESVNEELLTVNSEHQQKIEELTRLNNDMDNLLESTNIGTIFLDEDLCVRKFTPVVKKNINLRERDKGRPLEDISSNINYDNLVETAKKVMAEGIKVEEKIQTDDGDWYLMKIMPYLTRENKTSGTIITFIDINTLQERTKELQKLSYAVEHSPFIIVITDKEATITYVNQTFCEITGYEEDEIIGENTRILKSGETPPEVYRYLWQEIKLGNKWQGEFINRRKDGDLYEEIAYIFPLLGENEEVTHYVKFSVLPEQMG